MESILAFLENQQFALLAAMIVPFIYKYVPWFKGFSNELCALLAALSAWAINVFAPEQAHAGQVAIFGGILSPVATIFVSALDAIVTKFAHDWILNPAYKAVGLKKPQ